MLERVINIIANYLDAQTEDIKPNTELRELTLDSLDWVEIIIALEDEFGIDVPDDDFDKLITIQDIADYFNNNTFQAEQL